ncbi:hypothetical protein EV667_0033 [Ancylobacter aquaticus]|uniref:Uncharacterized protein n=1 Tax=Ancylobacter aquaticus TaxID=100 RepID=A0A4R1I4Z5_ANCAQ|nr:hypothetical protein [Ancylobacter aquaticus]TCK29948.1 hypothetical protein EV667_0033 [Ancylobacter aquaticus]
MQAGRIYRLSLMSFPAALFLALPVHAGVAEREPPPAELWIFVIGIAALSWVMACRRWWLPLAVWLPTALFVASLVADFADPVIGPAVREELGLAYVLQADLAGALMLVVPLMLANIRFSRKD